jgi:hypothetical protein
MSNKPLTQDGNEVREMTATELAEYKQLQTELAATEAAQAAKAVARQAVLDKLGLSQDEVQALLG